jgi:hypothetical protein
MIGSAFIKGNEINLRFEWVVSGKIEKVECELGTPLLDFVWMQEEITDKLFDHLEKVYLMCRAGHEDFDSTLQTFMPYLKTALEKNLYLYLYVDAFVSSVLKSAVKPQEAFEDVREYLLDDSELIGIDTNSPEAFAIAIRMVLINDIKRRQKLLLEDLDVIYGENKEYKDCSSLQRMYLLILSGKNYLSGEFTTTLYPDYAFDENADETEIKSAIVRNKVDVVEMVNIDTLSDLIRFELFNTIKNKLTIKRCGYCGGYFIPRGRTDMEYCNRIILGEKKRCNEIGAFRKRATLVKTDPVFIAYIAAVKRMSKRKNATNGLSEKKYQDWSWQAVDKRDKCIDGEISLEEFKNWLDETSRINNKRKQ